MQIENLSYCFNSQNMNAVSHISASFNSPGLISLIGPSGSGKTTLLRLMGGVLAPTSGKVISDHSRKLLGPTKTLDENTLLDHIAGGQHTERLNQLLDLLELGPHAIKTLAQLSQDELERAQLAKTLFHPPRILLLDGPYSGLGPQFTFSIQRLLKKIAQQEKRLIIMTTHHINEAMAFSDEIVVMKDGRLIQRGSPQKIYRFPCNTFVAKLFGPTNFILGKIVKVENYIQVETPLGVLVCQNNYQQNLHQNVLCHFRPEDVEQLPRYQMRRQCQIEDIYFLGTQTICRINYQDNIFYSSNIKRPTQGKYVDCDFVYGKGQVLKPESEYHGPLS